MTIPLPDPFIEVSHPDFYATIRYVGDGWELMWFDWVVNEWTELYPKCSQAVARLALLFACEESDWAKGFMTEQAEFVRTVDAFLDANIV